MKRLGLALTCSLIALAATAPGASAQSHGGVADIATIGEPPTLDAMVSATDIVGTITQHIFETLYTFDADWKVAPLLAVDLPEISEDGTVYTIALRQGITFHDGSAMTSSDVLASLTRWTEVASRGKQAAAAIEAIEAIDDFTIRITLTRPYAPLLSLLAFNNAAAIIIPEEDVAVPLEKVTGTGPYKLQEHLPDQYIQLVRFDDYSSRSEDPSKFAGARHAYLDEIRFLPVPDANTRVEASVAGEYDYVDSLPVEAYPRLEQGKSEALLLQHFGWPIFVMNTKEGVLADPMARKAVQAALDTSDMLIAAFGDTQFYSVDGPLYPEGYVWRSEVGIESYNVGDPEAAGEFLAQSEYDGQPLRILTSQQYPFHYKMAQVAQAYLELAGFKVDMQVVEWATLVQRNKKPELWDVFITHSPFLPEPSLNFIFSPTAGGWWDTPEKAAALLAFDAALTTEERVEKFADLQALYFEQAPVIKIGDFSALSSKSKSLGGFEPSPWPAFWNAYITE
ncbi:peptide ABC transporter [Devosia limi DSM 17137]|uniref:Peptide ABC transporter n=1 Tax=Devosia limi DSM 17137 TaxID=1121477 RepID=A0A0F5LP12_9HYPH|nr:ABC transporter substrate-binding protein [Devosia limi]KKB83889.1 peptide ABC transporter [Devosia limi DSM 17137]SHE44883.1 peptide/nickel transport system substrate-binding protein [Devosia limi DSM 17137]